MTLIADRIQNFIKEFEELDILLKENQVEMSKIDTDLSKLYHRIEGVEIKHVSESHALIKELKVILNKRREIKLNYILLSTLCQHLKSPIANFTKNQKAKLEKHNEIIDRLGTNN